MAKPKNETFFPGVRKGTVLEHVTPLANAAGERRLKFDLTIDLSDGAILGLPEWLDDPLKLVQKVEAGQKMNESVVELDGCMVRCFASLEAEAPAVEIPGALLKKFTVRRSSTEKPSGEVAGVELAFAVYTSWNSAVWAWAGELYNRTFYAAFGTAQARLTFGPPVKDGKPTTEAPAAEQQKLPVTEETVATQPGESDEDARKRATSPEFDKLFPAGSKPADGPKGKSAKGGPSLKGPGAAGGGPRLM